MSTPSQCPHRFVRRPPSSSSAAPSSGGKALGAERDEADKRRQLVRAILPLDAWEEGFGMMRRGEAVKILVDMEA